MISRSRLGLVAVIVLFALPLMYGLREPDLRSDEAIYSYAVLRVLDTGDWLTPRSIPSDEPFLEKPPLKIWIVAAGIASGLLPRDERGLRFFDGLFGAIAFVYVFALGRRLGGTVCGVVAVLVLFEMAPLIFDHGLRSNNMEASLVLCYCGGIFHFSRWMESEARGRRRRHAMAVAGFFALGFLTKFVAALFLPCVCLAALAWQRGSLSRVRETWRDWLLPVALIAIVTAPWFIYETLQFGERFWHVIFGVHVFTRFAGTLDPEHLHAWHYYFSATWRELARTGGQVLVLAGLVLLGRAAWRAEPGPARVVLIWSVLPLALISIGTSKLLHYAYPFWPPLALAAGLAFASALRAIDGAVGASLAPRLARIAPMVRRTRPYLLAGGVAYAALATWTMLVGPVVWTWNDITILRSTSFVREVSWSVILVFLGVYGTTPVRIAGGILLMTLLPLRTYASEIRDMGVVDHPLRATAECAASVEAASGGAGRGVLSASGNILHHSYYYYLWHLGPWTIAPEFSAPDVIGRLATPGGQTMVILKHSDYDALYRSVSGTAVTPPADMPASSRADVLAILTHDAVRYDDNIAVLLPGPYARCAAPILAAGGRPIWSPR